MRGNGGYHLRDVRKWLGGFTKAFPGEILGITTEQIDAWLQKLGGKSRSKNNAQDHVIAFLNFAGQKDYLPKGIDHAELGTSPFKDKREVIRTEEEALEDTSGLDRVPV